MKNKAWNQWIEIDKSRFLSNVAAIQKVVGTDIAAVVKGNGYGHGMTEATALFYEAGIRHFCTYHAHNALKMKKAYPDCRWIAMGPVRGDELLEYFKHEVELFVWDHQFMNELTDHAQEAGQVAQVHIELETGMYRTGILPEVVMHHIEDWTNHPSLNIRGVCTHFSGADEEDNLHRIDEQLKLWKFSRKELAPYLPQDVLWHGESSSASVYLKRGAFNLARIGLMMYGFFPSPMSQNLWPKHEAIPSPSIQLKSKVSGFNDLPKGRNTGYGKSFQASQRTPTAILPVGYADGIPRALSNQWSVKAGNEHHSSIGRINMNMMVIEGDRSIEGAEAVIINKEGPYDWYAASEKSGRFIYEMLTCLPAHLPRLVKT